MKSDRRYWAVGTAVVALIAFVAGIHISRQPPAPLVGSLADGAVQRLFATKLPATTGELFSLSTAKGKPLIVNFWATWCAPCLKEMPLLSKLQEDHPEISVIGIAADIDANVLSFAEKNHVSYPLLLGGSNSFPLMTDLGNLRRALPFTIVMDAEGRPVASILGGLSESTAEKIVALLTQRR